MKYTAKMARRKLSFEELVKCAAKRHTAPEIPGGFALPRLRKGATLRAEVIG